MILDYHLSGIKQWLKIELIFFNNDMKMKFISGVSKKKHFTS